jgi:hypothetical protein
MRFIGTSTDVEWTRYGRRIPRFPPNQQPRYTMRTLEHSNRARFIFSLPVCSYMTEND